MDTEPTGTPAETDATNAISGLGYEQCRDDLVEVVRALEAGGMTLDASLALWERGEALAKRCEQHLAGARKRVADALGADESDDD